MLQLRGKYREYGSVGDSAWRLMLLRLPCTLLPCIAAASQEEGAVAATTTTNRKIHVQIKWEEWEVGLEGGLVEPAAACSGLCVLQHLARFLPVPQRHSGRDKSLVVVGQTRAKVRGFYVVVHAVIRIAVS